MREYDTPLQLWYKGFVYYAEIKYQMDQPENFRIEEETPRKMIDYNTIDIPEYV